jgi:hypothetical protein
VRRLLPTPLDPVDPADVYGDPPTAGPIALAALRLWSVREQDGFLFLRYQPEPDR